MKSPAAIISAVTLFLTLIAHAEVTIVEVSAFDKTRICTEISKRMSQYSPSEEPNYASCMESESAQMGSDGSFSFTFGANKDLCSGRVTEERVFVTTCQ